MSNVTQPISKCYRPGRQWLLIGIVGAIFFSMMGFDSFYAAYWNIDGSFPHPKADALVYAVFWSLWTLSAYWLIAAYFRTRLTVTPVDFTQQGCFIRRHLAVADVSGVTWKGIPQAGKLILQGDRYRMRINLSNLTDKDRTEFIQLVRELFDHEVQSGWSDFNRSLVTRPPSPQAQRRVAIRCALIFFSFGLACLVCGWFNLGVQFYVCGVASVFVAVWYIWRIQRNKRFTAG